MPTVLDYPPVLRGTILVVDDAPVDLTLMEGLLSHAGHRVLAAPGGAQALRQVADGPAPDLVMLDVCMPGMDGYQVLERLRSLPASAALPVVFHTALDEAVDEARGLTLGADDYIAKQADPEVKLARVRAQLERARSRRCLSERSSALEAAARMAQHDGLAVLAHLAALRDGETGRHSQRTQAYVAALARRLRTRPRYRAQLGDEQIALLVRSAPLHDLGKIGIADRILFKPGKLDAEEWAVMQSHTLIGADAIERAEREAAHEIPFLRLAKQMARSHHEHWDGSGYPDGLAGEAIPLAARLMAVADVFDALVSARPYKAALPHAEAREVIRGGRGRHFDPVVVDAFEEAYDEFDAIAQRVVDPSPPVGAG